MSRFLAIVIGTVLFIGAADEAGACSCVVRSPCSMYGAADAVFAGRVTSMEPGAGQGDAVVAHIEVTRVWKGPVGKHVTVHTDTSSCGIAFSVGQQFLVYGRGEGTVFQGSMCQGAARYDPNGPDPALPPMPGRITGSVVRFAETFTTLQDSVFPIAGARIWLSAGTGVLETRTDENGLFLLDAVPVGTHVVHAESGSELAGTSTVSIATAADCGYVLIVPEPPGRQRGIR